MLEEKFLDLIKGKSKGPCATIARSLLRCFSFGYGLGAATNNFLFDKRFRKINRLPRPVISIGNITLGGTGKTPFTAWLADYFQSRESSPALISRGYQSQLQPGETVPQNDEARELSLRLSHVPHLQGSNRFQTAQLLLEQYPQTSIFLLDDAFQHRKLARDLDIVLLDALDPFGLNALFPRGLLREPLSNLKRADVILLSRADLIPPEERIKIKQNIEHWINKNCIWGEIAHHFRRVFLFNPQSDHFQNRSDHFQNNSDHCKNKGDHSQNNSDCSQNNSDRCEEGRNYESTKYPGRFLDFDIWHKSFSENRFIAFCGLGNPEGFRRSLTKAGISPIAFRVFPDHYHYTKQDLKSLVRQANELQATGFLTTMKDRVKLTPDLLKILENRSLAALETGIEFLTDPEPLESVLNSLLNLPWIR